MAGELIARDQHVVRHCASKHVFDDGSVSSASFELRRKDGLPVEPYVSVGWLEVYAKGDRLTQIHAYRKTIHPNIRTIKKNDKLAVLNVGQTVDRVRANTTDERILNFRHYPSEVAGKVDPGHAGIHGTATDETRITELLVESVVDTYPGQ
jgi:hypothetical protein